MPPGGPRVEHLHLGEGAPADMALQPVPDGLHLGQLGQCDRPAFPLDPARVAVGCVRIGGQTGRGAAVTELRRV